MGFRNRRGFGEADAGDDQRPRALHHPSKNCKKGHFAKSHLEQSADGHRRGASTLRQHCPLILVVATSDHVGPSMLPTTPNAGQAESAKRARACKIAMLASFSVGVVELALGLSLGLASLAAEGVHTVLDGVDSIVVLIAVYVAARPADRTHQFGHGKFEALGAAVEGTFIVVAAIG